MLCEQKQPHMHQAMGKKDTCGVFGNDKEAVWTENCAGWTCSEGNQTLLHLPVVEAADLPPVQVQIPAEVLQGNGPLLWHEPVAVHREVPFSGRDVQFLGMAFLRIHGADALYNDTPDPCGKKPSLAPARTMNP